MPTFRAFSLGRKIVSGGHIKWKRGTTKQVEGILAPRPVLEKQNVEGAPLTC